MLGRGLESLIPRKDNVDEKAPEIFSPDAVQNANLPVGEQQMENSETHQPVNEKNDRKNFESELTAVPKIENAGDINSGIKIKEVNDHPEENSAPEKDLILDIPKAVEKINFQEIPKKHQEAIFLIEVDEIKPNPHQPRRHFDEESLKELAASIQEFGILQPLLVSKIEEETENGTKVSYQLIAGERRFMAAKMLGLERVPTIIKKVDLEANNLEMAIIENIQRADLNPIESARAFAKLQDEFRLTQREIAQRVGKSREAVANTLRLLSLPSNIQDALSQKKINESQARTLLAVSDLNQQQMLFGEILNNDLSVRDLREKINPDETVNTPEDPEKKYLENQLEETLGTKVQINKNQNKGKIIIKFFSPEELDSIIKKICNSDQTADI